MFNEDIKRAIAPILKRGWFEPYQILGAGGWQALYGATPDWHKYRLLFSSSVTAIDHELWARDDQAAIKGFHELYFLDDDPYEIQRVATTYITIEGNI